MMNVSSNMASSWASNLFSQIDTNNKGYIEKSDLASAFSKISDNSTDIDQVFSQLDGNSDGKVTQDEMSSALQKIADQLDSQFNSMRMQDSGQGSSGGAGGMPPPPPANDSGFTKDELASQLDAIGSSDSKRSALISNIVQNFDEADSNGDGKISFKEAIAFDQSSQNGTASTSSTTSDSSATASTTANAGNDVVMKIMQLMHAYQIFGQDSQNSGLSTALSVTA